MKLGRQKETRRQIERRTQRKEKHHPFSADANTYSNKSSAIDFTARENLCSIHELFSATIRRDRLSEGESIQVKNQISFNFATSSAGMCVKVKGSKDGEGKAESTRERREFERKERWKK